MIFLDQAGAGRATGLVIAPPTDLQHLIQHAFVQRAAPDPERRNWRVVPEAHANIVIAVSSDGRARCNVVGPRSLFEDLDHSDRELTCGVRLQIGALPVITNCAADHFADRSVPIAALESRAAKELARRIDGEAPDDAAMLRALFGFIRDAAAAHSPRFAHQVFTGIERVSQIATRMRAPGRTAYAHVREHVGLSPRTMLRIGRMERALHAAEVEPTWARAAIAAGFADQSHFIRESRRLLGETPEEWRRRAALPIRSILSCR